MCAVCIERRVWFESNQIYSFCMIHWLWFDNRRPATTPTVQSTMYMLVLVRRQRNSCYFVMFRRCVSRYSNSHSSITAETYTCTFIYKRQNASHQRIEASVWRDKCYSLISFRLRFQSVLSFSFFFIIKNKPYIEGTAVIFTILKRKFNKVCLDNNDVFAITSEMKV